MLSSDSVDGLLFLCGLHTLQYWIGDALKPSFCLRLVVLINTLCSVSTFTSVNLWGWGGDRGCGDEEGMDSVHRDGQEWGSVSVPVQTSKLHRLIHCKD